MIESLDDDRNVDRIEDPDIAPLDIWDVNVVSKKIHPILEYTEIVHVKRQFYVSTSLEQPLTLVFLSKTLPTRFYVHYIHKDMTQKKILGI